MYRVFLLSPARTSGLRAKMLFNPRAGFLLAQALQKGETRPLAEIFAFMSGLYFRGKRAYAGHFSRPPPRGSGGWVITPNRGLMKMEEEIGLPELEAFSSVDIDETDPRYRLPLLRDARRLAKREDCEYVLLGSISTGKYVSILLDALGERLLFPTDFVGRGDMSRGGLMLRSVRENTELAYRPVQGSVTRGKRPPKLSTLLSGSKTRSSD
jgi:hypothetical protein